MKLIKLNKQKVGVSANIIKSILIKCMHKVTD